MPRYSSARLQLGATYSADGATLRGTGVTVQVGLGSAGHGTRLSAVRGGMSYRSSGALYQTSGLSEQFKPSEAGIEQTFSVTSRPAGPGALTITVPVAGLQARGHGDSVSLLDSHGRSAVSYSNLRTVDAAGKIVPSTMAASANGQAIIITVQDSTARYPLTVDPTWSLVTTLPYSSGSYEQFGYSLAVSGNEAVVGTYSFNSESPAVVFTESAQGSWSELTQLQPQYYDCGLAVAISGSTIVAGCGEDNSVSVFVESAGSWPTTPTQVLTGSGGFGGSVQMAGSTILVGAPTQTGNGNSEQGTVSVFDYNGGSWPSNPNHVLTAGGVNGEFGFSMQVSGSTMVVGAPDGAAGGAAYVYVADSGSWVPSGLALTNGSTGGQFGYSVSISGNTIAVGAPEAGDEGEAYVFSGSGGAWLQSAAIPNPIPYNQNGSGEIGFGTTVLVSGSTLLADTKAAENPERYFWPVVFSYTPENGSWVSTGSFTPNAND